MKIRILICSVFICVSAVATNGQQHELSLVSGALKTGEHDFTIPRPGFIRSDAGFTFQAGYASRLYDGGVAAIYSEFLLTVTPKRDIDTSNVLSPRSYSTILFSPGLKLKLVPGLRYSPYVAAGVGVGRLKTSDTTVSGDPNFDESTRFVGAFNFGGGIDAKVFSHLSLRGEVRDFYSGTPQLNARIDNKQHNFMISAGVVITF